MMGVEEAQASSTMGFMPNQHMQNNPAKDLAGLAEGLEPSSMTEEEMDDYEQVRATSKMYNSSLSHC